MGGLTIVIGVEPAMDHDLCIRFILRGREIFLGQSSMTCSLTVRGIYSYRPVKHDVSYMVRPYPQ